MIEQEQYSTEFEEKKTDLQPKVLEIFETCSPEIKVIYAHVLWRKMISKE